MSPPSGHAARLRAMLLDGVSDLFLSPPMPSYVMLFEGLNQSEQCHAAGGMVGLNLKVVVEIRQVLIIFFDKNGKFSSFVS